MALSGSYNYALTRDNLIARALRIVGAIAQGETPSATAVTEASQTLNDIMKEWQADGLQLWKKNTIDLTGTVSAGPTITISPSTPASNVVIAAPWKVLEMYYRVTDTGVDIPILPITKQEYDLLSPKAATTAQGIPNQCFYDPPRATGGTDNAQGTFYLYPPMSSTFIANNTIKVTGIFPFQDFDASTDNPDVPNYLFNALTWALADQLSYEYGVGLAERSMITKKAQTHKAIGLSFDQEEGSIYLRPYDDYSDC
jgi:hypothetical protein